MLVAATAKIFSVQVAFGVRWPSADAPEESFAVNTLPQQKSRQEFIDIQAGGADDLRPARRSPANRYSSPDWPANGAPSGSSNRRREFPAPMIVYGPSADTFNRYFECGRNLDCLA